MDRQTDRKTVSARARAQCESSLIGVQSELDVIGSPNASTAVACSEWYVHMNGTYTYAAAR